MKKYFIVCILLLLPVAQAAAADWPHTKKYPVKVLKVLSPTEYQIKMLDTGKIYTFRLAHVAEVEKKNTKDEKWHKDNYKLAKAMVERELKQKPDEHYIEFEEDDIQFDGNSTYKIHGYFFPKANWVIPLNCNLMAYNIKFSGLRTRLKLTDKRSPNYSYYIQENGKDSKGKKHFERFTKTSL